jgi:hypothetical protein
LRFLVLLRRKMTPRGVTTDEDRVNAGLRTGGGPPRGSLKRPLAKTPGSPRIRRSSHLVLPRVLCGLARWKSVPVLRMRWPGRNTPHTVRRGHPILPRTVPRVEPLQENAGSRFTDAGAPTTHLSHAIRAVMDGSSHPMGCIFPARKLGLPLLFGLGDGRLVIQSHR